MKTLSFNLTNCHNIIGDFNDQKKVATWSGVYTIKDYNLLERSAKVACIIDVLVRFSNLDKKIVTEKLHLESIRLGMYEDLAKVTLNEISHKTKLMFPKLSKLRKELTFNELSKMNLSNDNTALFIAKIGDILNSYLEARVEKKLGSSEDDILYAIEKSYIRIEDARILCKDKDLADKIVASAHHLMTTSADDCQFVSIIDFTARQSQVKRWSRRVTLNKFNLLEHSGRVSCLVDVFLQIYKESLNIDTNSQLEILRYALYHDYPEVILNDTPSPVKQLYPNLDILLKDIEEEIMQVLELTDSKLSKLICKIADIYDCLYEAKQEQLLGNRDPEFQKVIDGYSENFEKQVNKYSSVNIDVVSKLKTLYL